MRLHGLLCGLLAVTGIAVAQDSNFSSGPQYLMNYGSPQFLRPITTPTLSLGESPAPNPVAEAGNGVQLSVTPGTTQNPPNLRPIYYGEPAVQPVVNAEVSPVAGEAASLIEISGTSTPRNLPASIVNVGVEETVDAQSLRERGYGVTVAEASSFSKTHKRGAPRLYTNRDIERFHGG